MSSHPYQDLPDHAFWRRAVAAVPPGAVDPLARVPFRLSRSDKVVTAGSCFAQHIARYLGRVGCTHHVTEPAHPLVADIAGEEWNYGVFSARYGNIYTTRQLVQLFDRAHGRFAPQESVWRTAEGGFVDPFRPQIQPGGFSSLTELEEDRRRHLAAVRRAFAECDVLVFTLGLTEAWEARADGAVFPLCPGVAGGSFDAARHAFRNFDVAEVTADLEGFLARLREVNPAARVILTVSPVPLVATAAGQHVLTATTYSKSVLRVACEQVTRGREEICYFPSYEIITGGFSRGQYFAEDCRAVTEAGVEHVMRVFLRHFLGTELPASAAPAAPDPMLARMARLVEVNCDEEALDPG